MAENVCVAKISINAENENQWLMYGSLSAMA
jgi:hypothetical protein